jgi:hypothetical protein
MRVCEARYPLTGADNDKRLKAGFYLEDGLKKQIDHVLNDFKDDWDYTIIISGSGRVRTGKSMIGMQIAAYWSDRMGVPFSTTNFVFNGADLIEKGHELGTKHPGSALIYDEAGADLESRKVMTGGTRAVLDYFRECGQYNLLNILIIPDFFDLPKGIACVRSDLLINVKVFVDDQTNKLTRGYFDLYDRAQKRKLYIFGKKLSDYEASEHSINGRFLKFYPIDEEEYRRLKKQALLNRSAGSRSDRAGLVRDGAFYIIHKYLPNVDKIAEELYLTLGFSVSNSSVSVGVNRIRDLIDKRIKREQSLDGDDEDVEV